MNKLLPIASTVLLALSFSSLALQPPTAEQIKKYKQESSLKKRIEDAKKFGNHQLAPALAANAQRFLSQKSPLPTAVSRNASHIPQHIGLPSKGDVKTFTLLIDFDEAPAPEHQSMSVMYNHIYGDGLAERFPVESLTNFYKRASYEKLNIQGNVLDWHRYSQPRSSLTHHIDAEKVVLEAIKHYANLGHDFSQYDNNNDGIIDYFSVIWTGDIGEWSTLWWGWQGRMTSQELIAGKKLGDYSWQWLSENNATDDFNPLVLIHETGHGLGLPDFYDYDADIGPDGGVGGLDMMDHNYGDHGAFSKFLLGWIEPEVINSGTKRVNLAPSSSSQDALVIMPQMDGNQPTSEYFVIQNRDQKENDLSYPTSGLLIWHANADTNEFRFINDNSYTDNKLIKLVQADGLDEIEKQSLLADENDYYQPEDEFSTTSTPDSRNYALNGTGVEITNIVNKGQNIEFTASIVDMPTITSSNIHHLQNIKNETSFNAQVNSADAITQVNFVINEQVVGTDTAAPYQLDLASLTLEPGVIQLSIEALTEGGIKNIKTITLLNTNPDDVIVVDYDTQVDGQAIVNAINANNQNAYLVRDIPAISGSQTNNLFVAISSFTHYLNPLTADQSNNLIHYLSTNGNLYYENSFGVFAQAQSQAVLTNKIGITYSGIDKITQTDSTIEGVADTPLAGLSYQPQSINLILSDLTKTTPNSTATPLLKSLESDYTVTMHNQVNHSNVIVSSAKFSEVPSNEQQLLMQDYLDILKTPTTDAHQIRIAQALSVLESESVLTLTLSRNATSESDSIVNLSFIDNTAKQGIHYHAPAGNNEVLFKANELSKEIILALTADNQIEQGDLTFKVLITGDSVSKQNETLVTIKDDEHAGRIKFSAQQLAVDENISTFEVKVIRQGEFNVDLPYSIRAASGSAEQDVDFEFAPTSAVFDGQNTEHSYLISVKHDAASSQNKLFTLELESEYLAEDYQHLEITIKNIDETGAIRFAQESISVLEDSHINTITLKRVNGTADTLQVNVKTKDGSATAGTDYLEIDQTITFSPGETEKTIEFAVFDNQEKMPTKSFQIELTGEYQSSGFQQLTVNILDDEDKRNNSGSLHYLLLGLLLLIRFRKA